MQLFTSCGAVVCIALFSAKLTGDEKYLFGLVESLWAVSWIAFGFWVHARVIAFAEVNVRAGSSVRFFLLAIAATRIIHILTTEALDSSSSVPTIAAWISFSITICQIVIEGIQRYWQYTFVGSLLSEQEVQRGVREPSREFRSSFLARLTFSWIDPLLLKARSKPLEDEDVWDLSDIDKTAVVVDHFKEFQLNSFIFSQTIFREFTESPTFLLQMESSTFFLNRIIVFLQSPKEDQTLSGGLYLLAGLLLGQLITSTISGWVFYLARRNAINIRSTLVSEIYEKALRRSAGVKSDKKDSEKAKSMFDKPDQKANIGKIVSLMSSDANRLYNFAGFIHRPLIDLPLSCIISISALLYLLGPSAMAGLLVVLISGPATGLISQRMIKEQMAYSSATDHRTQVINEALQGIRILKYFGWEEEFVKRIGKARENELSKAVRLWIYFIGYIVIAWGGSILVVFSSFFCYTVIAGHSLDPATAFTSVTLLHQVGISLNVLPMIGMQLMRAKVSLDRIADFLKEEELEKYEDSSNGFNSNISNYMRKKARTELSPSGGDSEERAPLLSSASASSCHVVPILEDGENSVSLPSDYVPPLAGFFKGTFIYFGSDDKKPEVDTSNQAPKATRWGFRWWKKRAATASEPVVPSVQVGEDGIFELRDITVRFHEGKLNVITGPTGSGKSSLLLSMLGGKFSIAFAAQQAFLLNATIRENILFGSRYEESRYRAVLEACSLVRDLQILEGGDLTEIGEKGINLSGARAAYSRAEIILMDDCLSAVDAPTAKHIVFNCILGPLMKDKTRILVTHAIGLVLPHADYVVVMKNGEVAASGRLEELKELDAIDFELKDFRQDRSRSDKDNALSHGDPEEAKVPSVVAEKGTKIIEDEDKSTGSVKLSVYVSYFKASGGMIFFLIFLLAFVCNTVSDLWIKIWTDASRASLVSLDAGNLFWFLRRSSWLSRTFDWTLNDGNAGVVASSEMWASFSIPLHASNYDENAIFYISVYAAISLLGLLASVLSRLWVLYGGLLASRNLHTKLTVAVFGAPMRFFEKTPLGRLLNRFTKDIATIDNDCMDNLDSFFKLIIQMAATVVLILYVAPVSALIIPFVVFCLYLESSRELKRLESISNSPVYAQFSETLMGVSTVRAYGTEKQFSESMVEKVDANNRNSFYLWTANRWLNLRCEYLSAVMTSVVGLAIILSGLDPGWAGLTMIYVFEFTSNLTWLIRCHANMDMAMNAVERIEEYAAIEQEPPAVIASGRPSADWPSKGRIEVQNLTLRYQDDLPNVLHGLTFTVLPAEKIGIVGRTGAGKSSLTLAFFRILNNFGGSIVIDDVDISKIGLQDLRSRLTIIPQDPVLFEGTLRFNLDPLGTYTDDTIWDAVKAVGLLESMQKGLSRSNSSASLLDGEKGKGAATSSSSSAIGNASDTAGDANPTVPKTGGGVNLTLESNVAESGNNFSQGQRQLICLARAILRQTKVFFLDEATASVDEATDSRIQKTIRTSFKDATVITIAHRLKTIADYDRVLVLERGKIEEFDAPINLINKKNGLFRKMCEESGDFQDIVKLASAARSQTGSASAATALQ
ncbi:hypothetical protein HDU83_006290 [Entophlyctis luteolus]|nr:hypothetical protein HDU83_006290 [Entophlyctis luteolus]